MPATTHFVTLAQRSRRAITHFGLGLLLPAALVNANAAAPNHSRAVATASSGAVATANPIFSPSKRLLYSVKLSKLPFLSLNGELLWRNLGTSYSAQLSYSALGLTRAQISQGRINATGLVPERFIDQYRKQKTAYFDTARQRIRFDDNNAAELPLLAGAQDRLSVMLQIGAWLAGMPNRTPIGAVIKMQVVGTHNAEVRQFLVQASETLKLPGGIVQSVKIECQPSLDKDKKIEVWLAPQLGWLPARIRITEANGDSADQQWRASEELLETGPGAQ